MVFKALRSALLAISLLFFMLGKSKAQVNVKDSSLRFAMLKFSYAYQFPGGDLAKRFGNNSSLGFDFMVKTQKRLLLGVDFKYIFGNEIKEDVLSSIKTPDGNLIGQTGYYEGTTSFERGWSAMGKIGYVFSFKGISPNPNCGPFITLGAGIMEHKIRIEIQNNNVTSLTADTKKGYDRLSNGPVVAATAGYMFLSNKRLINFFLAVEYLTAFTQNRRGFNYDTGLPDTKKQTDNLFGIRIGWIIPLYKKQPADIYYN
jgi:hypothetical protein